MSTALAVFAKRPVPGQVKTRLSPHLSPDAAAALYWAMVQDTWAIVSALSDVQLHLFVDQPWQGFLRLADGCPIQIQTGTDLGRRMYSCFKRLRGSNFTSLIIIGTDSPTLPAAHIQAAFGLLASEADAVLGPAEDGGYYLVGCRQPHPAMFDRVVWSSPDTLAQTRAAFDAHGYRTHLAPLWRDVDSIADLQRLAQDPTGPAVQAWLDENPL